MNPPGQIACIAQFIGPEARRRGITCPCPKCGGQACLDFADVCKSSVRRPAGRRPGSPREANGVERWAENARDNMFPGVSQTRRRRQRPELRYGAPDAKRAAAGDVD